MLITPEVKTFAVFEHGSKWIKSVIVVDVDGKFKWAFVSPITHFAYHEYVGGYKSIPECLDEIDELLTREHRTRVL